MAKTNLAVKNASLDLTVGPAGGGQPMWGLNDQGFSSSDAPLFSTDPWDVFWLGTRKLPGECDIVPGGVAAVEVNVKKGKGTSGARVTLAGYAPKQFQVTCEICTDDQWAELQDIIDVYWTTPNKASNLTQIAVSVFHPNLAWIKIYSAVLVGVTPLVRGKSGEGFKMTTLTFQENAQPTKKNVTKSAGPPAEDKGLPDSHQAGGTPATPPSSVPANASVLGAPVSE
jgi:hypothetical protein